MKLLKLLENAIKENYTGVDIRMFALFADIFSDLVKGLKSGMLGEVYSDLSQKYEGTKKQLPLEYFYDFLTKNKEHFLKGEESLQEGDIKKETLFKYWDDKGIDAKPIYHYLNLDNQKEMDNHLISQYKVEYFDGIENMIKILYDRLEIGKPFTHFSGGYEINAVITNVNLQMSDGDSVGDYNADYLRNGIYYEIDSVINGENSSVTLFTTGEDYMLDDYLLIMVQVNF